MTGKHYGWQKRWRLDLEASTATHDTGLVVDISAGIGQAVNLEDLRAALTAKHGGHNVPPMVARLVREAERLSAAARSAPPRKTT